MNQPKQLQALLKDLRASETKMAEGDHIAFAMLCLLLFICPLVALIECNMLAFAVSCCCLGFGIVAYYWVYSVCARRSWYWEEVRREIEGKDLRGMWDTCERGDWLLWLSAHMIGKRGWPTHQQVVLAACQCARLAIRHVTSALPLKAIEMAEAWARGEATIDQVRDVGIASGHAEHEDAAYCAAQAASAAAWAVYASEDGCGFRLAQAASDAASQTSSAAGYEIFTAQLQASDLAPTARTMRDRVEKTILRECADIARRMLTVPNTLANELPIYKWVKRWDRNLNGKRTGRMNYIPVAVSRSTPGLRLKGTEIDNARPNPVLRTATVVLVLASAWTLIGALGKNPAQYYAILRWLTCAAATMLVWRGYAQGSLKWAYVVVPVAILFNPIIPIHLHGKRWDVLKTWQTVDVVVALVMVLVVILMEMQVLLARRR